MVTMFGGRFRRPRWYELLIIPGTVIWAAPANFVQLVIVLILNLFFGLLMLRLPTFSEGEVVIDYKHAMQFLKPKVNDKGSFIFPIWQMFIIQVPLLNVLFGNISIGTIYLTNRFLHFKKTPLGPLNKGKSFSIAVSDIMQINEIKFESAIDLKETIIKLSHGKISKDDADAIFNVASLVPGEKYADTALKSGPKTSPSSCRDAGTLRGWYRGDIRNPHLLAPET